MFGVSRANADQEIDVVVLWVDGSDPLLTEKRERYLKEENRTFGHTGALATHFASTNEIRYCILSILTFAPFVRNIFLVTDGQDPDLYDDLERYFPERSDSLRIVDHKALFRGYEDYLPSFNSTSISALLWRIEGLSENFIYFNDDVFLIRESRPEDWFVGNRPVLRGKWKAPPYKKMMTDFFKNLINKRIRGDPDYQPRLSFYLRQWNAASLLGMRFRYYFHDHTAHPMNRKRLEDFFTSRPDLLQKNISYRFRSRDQFLITALANHLEIIDHNRHLAPLNLSYLHPYYSKERLKKKILRSQKSEKIKSICVQSLEMIDKEIQDEIFDWMERILNLKT